MRVLSYEPPQRLVKFLPFWTALQPKTGGWKRPRLRRQLVVVRTRTCLSTLGANEFRGDDLGLLRPRSQREHPRPETGLQREGRSKC
jgi:hypothetical protein